MSARRTRAVILVGSSHRRAPVAVRERLCLDPEQALELARNLAAESDECVVLATCNRTELYLASSEPEAVASRARRELARLAGLPEPELVPVLYSGRDKEAVLHLLRVASGLDSLVAGESQVLGQVRGAQEAARAAATVGPVLNRLFGFAVRAGKRVRSETGIGRRPSSISDAAVALAARILGGLEGRRVILIGAGKMAELTAASLRARGIEKIVVANRTLERARDLAGRFGGIGASLDQLGEELAQSELIIACTRCPFVVLSAEHVAWALEGKGARRIVFIDIAVPRDLDPAIAELDGCALYDIDDLGEAATGDLAAWAREKACAEAIIAEEAARFRAWQRSLELVPAIVSLHRRAEEIRAVELARVASKLAALSPSERQALETLTRQLVSELLHLPTVRMKETAASSRAHVRGRAPSAAHENRRNPANEERSDARSSLVATSSALVFTSRA